MSTDILDVKINPKILGGVHDYITAATYEDMDAAITNFDSISQHISPLLKTFNEYTLRRVDYCINFALDELVPKCSPEQMMNLIKRADIPPHYHKWAEYDPVSHRMKSRPSSFYLISNSVNINCYSKYMKLQEQTQENIKRRYPPIPQRTMEAARDIIRFEVQCKVPKIYTLSRRLETAGNRNTNKYHDLLCDDACNDMIYFYWKKTVGDNDWYTFRIASSLIRCKHFNRQKEQRLIDALQEINQSRSVANAKTRGIDPEGFKRTMNDLISCNINLVTIPKEWGINQIHNLYFAYCEKVSMERFRNRMSNPHTFGL